MNDKRVPQLEDIDRLLAAGAARERVRHTAPEFVRSVVASLPDYEPAAATGQRMALLLPALAVLLAGLIAQSSGVLLALGYWLQLGLTGVVQPAASAVVELLGAMALERNSGLLGDPLLLVCLIGAVTVAPLWLLED